MLCKIFKQCLWRWYPSKVRMNNWITIVDICNKTAYNKIINIPWYAMQSFQNVFWTACRCELWPTAYTDFFLFLTYLHSCLAVFDFQLTGTFTILIYTSPSLFFFFCFGTIHIPKCTLFIYMISDFTGTCVKIHLLSFYTTRRSKRQLQNASMVLKGPELKCHFLCMVLNGLLFWTFINQRPSISVSNHRQTKKKKTY